MVPHALQWFGSVSRSTQLPLQSVCVLSQLKPQVPVRQAGTALATEVVHVWQVSLTPHAAAVLPAWQVPDAQQPVPQDVAHIPQWLGSVWRSTQTPPHRVYPDLQVMPHVLALHVAVPLGSVGHAWPHVPQFATLTVVSAQPLGQRVGVAVGQPFVQAELTQAGVPLSRTHALLQAPQCGLLLVRSTHAPLQLVYPLLQVMPQVPPLQAGDPLVTPEHLVLQPPQWFGSVLVSMQVELNPQCWPQPPFTQQPPLHEAATHPASGADPVSGALPSGGLLPSSPDESGTTVSSRASFPPSSPESVPTVVPSGTLPSSPVEVSGFG